MDDNASGSNSRASSLDPDSPNTLVSTNSGEDSDPTVGSKGKLRRGRPNKKKFTKKKSTPRPEPRVKKVTDYLKSLEVNMNGMDPTPDTSVTESGPNSRSMLLTSPIFTISSVFSKTSIFIYILLQVGVQVRMIWAKVRVAVDDLCELL